MSDIADARTSIPPVGLPLAPALRLEAPPPDDAVPADPILALAVFLLVGLGVVMVFSASALSSAAATGATDTLL